MLKACYRKLDAPQAEERFLHPLGVLLRSPQHYLIAYDAKDLEKPSPRAKMFLIHRLEDVLMVEDSPSQLPAGASAAQLVQGTSKNRRFRPITGGDCLQFSDLPIF